jgi:methionine synthase II (cobalamin-independent)
VSGPLDRLPPWSTTGVGSLPYLDPAAAVEHALGEYDLPFCPQLPRVDGDMISEWLGSDPRRCGWSPQRDRERPVAWEPFLSELDRAPPQHRLVKLQVTGPFTLACALERSAGERPERAAAAGLAAELAAWLAAAATGQVRTLAERGLTTVLIVDEPALAVLGTSATEGVWDPLRAAAPLWGLHICCPVPWDLVERTGPDVLSFDLALGPVNRRGALALERLAARGTRIAWGVVAAHRVEAPDAAARRLTEVLARSPSTAEAGLLTPSCGTGRLSVARERDAAAILRELAGRLARRESVRPAV